MRLEEEVAQPLLRVITERFEAELQVLIQWHVHLARDSRAERPRQLGKLHHYQNSLLSSRDQADRALERPNRFLETNSNIS